MFKKLYKLGEMNIYNKLNLEELENHTLIDLFWECTLTCNAKCKHCGSSAKNQKYEGELTTEEIKNAFKQIAEDYDASKILINVTGGEPLVRSDLGEVMEYATNELGYHWGMTTNGILFTDKNIEKMKKANMETVSISIDGVEETHDKFRGVPGSYEKIIHNIKRMRELGYKGYLQVTTVVHKENLNQLEELYGIMKELKLNSWRIASMDPIGRANENTELLLNGEEIKQVLDFIKAKNKKKELQIDYGCASFLGLKYEKEVRGWYFVCRTGINVASILYNGDLFVCPNVERRPELIQGNIRTDRFKEAWENKYQQFRNVNRTTSKECKECEWWDYCRGGSFHTWDFDKNVQRKCVYNMMNGD